MVIGMGESDGEVFALREDRPTIARMLLSLDPETLRVFSMKDRKKLLDLLEEAYPSYLAPSTIAKKIGSDNKSVSNALNYLVRSSGMIECRFHEYRLAQALMRPMEGRFERVRFGLGLVVLFALAAGLLIVSGFSSPLLALAYLCLCFCALYSYTKRRQNILFLVLAGLMMMGEAGYVLWHVADSREVGMWLDGTSQARAILLRASGTAGELRQLGTTIETEDLAALSTRLDADLEQAAGLLLILASAEGEAAGVVEEIANDLFDLAAANVSSFILRGDDDALTQRILTRIADLVGRSVKRGRTWLGTAKSVVNLDMARTARANANQLLTEVTQ